MVLKEKFKELAEAITANLSFNMELRQISSDCDRTNIFVLSVFKDRINHLKSELLKKVAIINHFSTQILWSKFSNSQNRENIRKVLDQSLNSSNINVLAQKRNLMALLKVVAIMKYKVIIMRDSFFQDIYEKGLNKNHSVRIKNSLEQLDFRKIDNLILTKPDCLIVHAGITILPTKCKSFEQCKEDFKESQHFAK